MVYSVIVEIIPKVPSPPLSFSFNRLTRDSRREQPEEMPARARKRQSLTHTRFDAVNLVKEIHARFKRFTELCTLIKFTSHVIEKEQMLERVKFCPSISDGRHPNVKGNRIEIDYKSNG